MKLGFIVSTGLALFLAVVVVMGMGQLNKLKNKVADLEQEKPAKSVSRIARPATATGPSSSSRPSGPAKSDRASTGGDSDKDEDKQLTICCTLQTHPAM